MKMHYGKWDKWNQKKEEDKKIPTIDYPIVTDDKKGELIISPQLEEQINLFHAIAGDTEWSGILLYVIKEGDISKPESLVIEAKGIFPMDIGTASYTEYDYDEKTLDMYDLYPNALEEEWRLGHIHTHHSMRAFFSGTDLQELRDNIDNHAYYLSLIVNFEKKYCAKLCIKGEREVKESSILKYTGLFSSKRSNKKSKSTKIEAIVYSADLEIEMPEEKEETISFIGEILKLKKKSSTHSWSKSNADYRKDRVDWGKNLIQSNGTQVSLWDDVGHSSNESLHLHSMLFLMKLINVDTTYANETGETLDEFLKKAQRKFKSMTESDTELYLSYIEDNVKGMADAVIDSFHVSPSALVDGALDILTRYTSREYGYSAYDEDSLADQVCVILEEMGYPEEHIV